MLLVSKNWRQILLYLAFWRVGDHSLFGSVIISGYLIYLYPGIDLFSVDLEDARNDIKLWGMGEGSCGYSVFAIVSCLEKLAKLVRAHIIVGKYSVYSRVIDCGADTDYQEKKMGFFPCHSSVDFVCFVVVLLRTSIQIWVSVLGIDSGIFGEDDVCISV